MKRKILYIISCLILIVLAIIANISKNNKNKAEKIEIATCTDAEVASPMEPATTTAATEEAIIEEEPKVYIYSIVKENIRRGPGVNFEIVGEVPQYSRLELIANEDDNWVEIKIDNQNYFIYKKSTSPLEPSKDEEIWEVFQIEPNLAGIYFKSSQDKLINWNDIEKVTKEQKSVTVVTSTQTTETTYEEKEAAVSEESTPENENTEGIVGETEGGSMTYVGWFELTAYTHTGNPMASGIMPFVGACACNSLPLGTVIYIEGYGTFTVLDTGGMGGGVIDIFMDSYDECIQFGRQGGNVYIIK